MATLTSFVGERGRLVRELAVTGEREADRMKAEIEAAAAVQQALLPRVKPDLAGVRVEWLFRPTEELAGDILNVFRIDERRLGVYVLDVTGHGVASALLS